MNYSDVFEKHLPAYIYKCYGCDNDFVVGGGLIPRECPSCRRTFIKKERLVLYVKLYVKENAGVELV